MAGSNSEPDREVSLAHSGWPEDGDVLCASEKFECREIPESAWFETRLEGVVEVVEGFVVRQPGEFEGVAESFGFADGDFFGEEMIDEVEVPHLRRIGAGGGFGDGVGSVTETESDGVVDDSLGGQRAHEYAFRS